MWIGTLLCKTVCVYSVYLASASVTIIVRVNRISRGLSDNQDKVTTCTIQYSTYLYTALPSDQRRVQRERSQNEDLNYASSHCSPCGRKGDRF